MKKFEVLGPNPLKKIKAGKKRWLATSEDNVAAITASTEAKIIALLAPTTDVNDRFKALSFLMDGDLKDRALKIAARSTVYDNFSDAIMELEGDVKKAFKTNMDVYNKEFFPLNTSEYSRAVLSEQELLINRIKVLVTKYVTELGLPTETLFAQLNSDYATAQSEQMTASKKCTANSVKYKLLLDELQDQLWENMLVIAGVFVKVPGMAATYFNLGLLYPRHKNRAGILIDKPLKITIKPSSIVLTDFAYTSADTILIENHGKGSFYYFSTDEMLTYNTVPGDAIEIKEGEEISVLASVLKKYFYLANISTSVNAVAELSQM